MKICKNCSTYHSNQNWICPECGLIPEGKDGFISLLTADEKCIDFGYRQDSFEILFELEANHFWFKSRNRLIVWLINKYFSNCANYLELGCGTGFVLSGIANSFPALKTVGSDISAVGLANAARRMSSVEMVQMDAANMLYFEEFELIGAFDVIEHIEDDCKALQEINKALKSGGGVIITVPQHAFLWSIADEQACHKRRYSNGVLKNKLEEAGFDVIRMSSFIALLFPAMLLSRALKQNGKGANDPLSELKLPKYLNIVFEVVCYFELLLIKAGINFPFGGSLVAACVKQKEVSPT
jgi:SAM-dependent methyltransferase